MNNCKKCEGTGIAHTANGSDDYNVEFCSCIEKMEEVRNDAWNMCAHND